MCSNAGGATTNAVPGNDFVSFPPSALNKSKERVVTLTDDGEYIYARPIPNFQVNVDTSAPEYKRALRDFNVKASFNSGGSVTVQNGGLYSKKRTFNSVDAFSADANKRIDNLKDYWSNQEKLTRSGKLSQIEAENIKSLVTNNSKSMAIKAINKQFKKEIAGAMNYTTAAEDMRRRLKVAVDKAKNK